MDYHVDKFLFGRVAALRRQTNRQHRMTTRLQSPQLMAEFLGLWGYPKDVHSLRGHAGPLALRNEMLAGVNSNTDRP